VWAGANFSAAQLGAPLIETQPDSAAVQLWHVRVDVAALVAAMHVGTLILPKRRPMSSKQP